MPGRHEELEALRAEIARIERRPPLAEAASPPLPVELLAAPAGLLCELFTDDSRNAGAALGFALAQARGLIGAARPAVIFVQLRHEAQVAGLPYGLGLQHFGIDPGALVLTRVADMGEFLWALEEAAGCRAVAAVVADIGGAPRALDFTVSRRLSLRAQATGTSIFMLRYGTLREASAARLRWRIAPVPSGEVPFDARAPGGPRWRATLEKGRLAAAGSTGADFLLDWTENGFLVVDSSTAGGTRFPAGHAPPPRAPSPALGDGLSQAG